MISRQFYGVADYQATETIELMKRHEEKS